MTIFDSLKPPRRQILKFLSGGAAATAFLRTAFAAKTVKIVEFDAAGVRTGVVEVEKIAKPDTEWKKQLTPEQFEVTRHSEASEQAFTGKYASNHDDGSLYHCICCNTVLFDSRRQKFGSPAPGWPEFFGSRSPKKTLRDPQEIVPAGMQKETKVVCAAAAMPTSGTCFDDSPPPTHLRYCMNSASLNFVPRGKQQSSR